MKKSKLEMTGVLDFWAKTIFHNPLYLQYAITRPTHLSTRSPWDHESFYFHLNFHLE